MIKVPPKTLNLILKKLHCRQCCTKEGSRPLQQKFLVTMFVQMYHFTTVSHPHGHWQLQELLGNPIKQVENKISHSWRKISKDCTWVRLIALRRSRMLSVSCWLMKLVAIAAFGRRIADEVSFPGIETRACRRPCKAIISRSKSAPGSPPARHNPFEEYHPIRWTLDTTHPFVP